MCRIERGALGSGPGTVFSVADLPLRPSGWNLGVLSARIVVAVESTRE